MLLNHLALAAQAELCMQYDWAIRDDPNRDTLHLHRTKLLDEQLECRCYLFWAEICGDRTMRYPPIWLIVVVSLKCCLSKLLMKALMQAACFKQRERVSSAAERLGVQPPAPENRIGRAKSPPKCPQFCGALRAARVGLQRCVRPRFAVDALSAQMHSSMSFWQPVRSRPLGATAARSRRQLCHARTSPPC
jgi:hypothetical protein